MKKIISLIMVLCIMASLGTVSAFAEEALLVYDEAELLAALADTSVSAVTINSNFALSNTITVDRPLHFYYNGFGSWTGANQIQASDNATYFGYEGGEGQYLISGTTTEDTSGWGYHVVTIPAPPVPEITNITNSYGGVPELSVAMSFYANPYTVTWAQFYYYKDWYADFSIKLDKTATFQKAASDASGESPADGYLAGQYDTHNPDAWEIVPFSGMGAVTINGGESFNVMEYAGFPLTLMQVYTMVGRFNCGIFFTDEYIEENNGVTVNIGLDMYPEWGNGEYIGDPINLNSQEVTITPPPKTVSNPYSVPSTADNSNMPLWTILFVGFAAVALLTGKKKKA